MYPCLEADTFLYCGGPEVDEEDDILEPMKTEFADDDHQHDDVTEDVKPYDAVDEVKADDSLAVQEVTD